MDASPVVVTQHRHLGTSMPSGGVHTIKVTRCRCFGMWRRQAALALNGTAGVQALGKEPLSYTAQLSTPTGRSVQQGDNAQQGKKSTSSVPKEVSGARRSVASTVLRFAYRLAREISLAWKQKINAS